MSIFNDKSLKSVAEAAAKIMAETSHGSTPKTPKEKSLAALAHPKDKITHKDVLVGRGVLKKEEIEKLDEVGDTPAGRKALGSYVTKATADKTKDRTKGLRKATSRMYKDDYYGKKNEEVELNEETEQLQEYESKGGVYKHKGNYGTSYKTDEEGNEIKPAKQKGYGARQNYVRGTSTGEKKKMKEELSFTEMLELYNEHGLKVLAPIETEEMDIDGTTIEVIDADKVNGVVDTIVEEPTEEEFNKELKDQQDSFAGKKKQPKVAAGKTTGVKVMPEEVEQIDEISADLAGKYLTAPQGKGANKYKVESGKSRYPNAETMFKHTASVKRALQRSDTSSLNKKPSYYKEEVELDERTLTSAETAKKEEIVKSMKKGLAGFKQRYGERAKEVMYATATKQAKKD